MSIIESLREPKTGSFTLVRNLLIGAAALGLGLAIGVVLSGGASTWPITLIGLSVYLIVIARDPLTGLLLWIVTAPFSRFVYLDFVARGVPDLSLTRVCAGFLLVVVMSQIATKRRTMFRPILLDGAVLAMAVGIAASIPAAQDGAKTAVTAYFDSYAIPVIAYFLARQLVRTRADAEKVCSAFIILGVILTSVAAQEQLTGVVLFNYSERSWNYTKEIHRLAGLLGNPAFFGTLIAMSSGFIVYRFVFATTPARRLLYGLLIPYVVMGAYFTFNRAGWGAMALDLLVAAIFLPGFRRLFLAGALAAALGLAYSWSSVLQSSVVTERLSSRGPVDYRIEIWGRAAEIFRYSPIFGLGYNNFGRFYLRYDPSWLKYTVLPQPHNTFLEVFFDNGLIGGLPYLASFILVAVGAIRHYRRARDPASRGLVLAFGLAFLPYLVEGMVVDMIFAYYVNLVLMLAVGAFFGWQTAQQPALQQAGLDNRPADLPVAVLPATEVFDAGSDSGAVSGRSGEVHQRG